MQALKRKLLTTTLLASAAMMFTVPMQAKSENYPERSIRLVVGYAAGGATDVIARLVSDKMARELGQTVVVENRTGANSNVGAQVVAKSAPDGYTLYMYTIANTINNTLYNDMGYDAAKDFAPVGLIAKIPNILVVNPKVPVKSVEEYVEFTRNSKDGITFASSGSGSSIHMSGEMFKMTTGLNMLHVPYRGSAPAVTDLIGGQVQSMFDNAPSAMPHIQAGSLRPLAVTSAKRFEQLPDVPTMIESGYPDFEVQSWFGLAAPAGTPEPIINTLNTALNKSLEDTDVQKRLSDMMATPSPGTPQDMQTFLTQEIENWGKVVKASGAKAN